ncbi:MAG: DUF4139 domain-containing protein [Polyangiaceae bacterium]
MHPTQRPARLRRFSLSSPKRLLSGFALMLALGFAPGCAATTSYVDTNANLGRVVVYRNGIAYFERTAEVTGDELELSVPADKVDDFLKSLTVTDLDTKTPTPIAYPTRPPPDGTGIINMKIQLRDGGGTPDKPRRLQLTYVTEAPSWKPSYRIVLGDDGKVELEAWAIVDNTSGEDWKNVKLGVGSSSALSFRFDLYSVRTVARETLSASDQFAVAPPTGSVVYGAGKARVATVIDEIDDSTLADARKNQAPPKVAVTESKSSKASPPMTAGTKGDGRDYKDAEVEAPTESQNVSKQRVADIARRVQVSNQPVVVEGYGTAQDPDRGQAALHRANELREQLIDNGVSPEMVVAVANTDIVATRGGARIIVAPTPGADTDKANAQSTENQGTAEPIGTSHFESKTPMSVARGTSAMVSILKMPTAGEVVYLFDNESARGNDTFAFRAVRLTNPTDSTLEQGPVTVFGEARFIGEGLTEPIPGKSVSFIPFALDRQIVVETKDDETDGIAKIITAERGVLSTEMKHRHKQTMTIYNRSTTDAVVYVRHTVPKGYSLTQGEAESSRIGDAHLFRVVVPGDSKKELVLEEETPILRSVDLRSPSGLELVKAYVSSAAIDGEVAVKLKSILELQRELGNVEERIETQREQISELRARMDELHAQVLTLKVVKTGGQLMKNLESKLDEISDRVSKATVDLVGLEEQRMIARIKLQDGVAELRMDSGETKVADKH